LKGQKVASLYQGLLNSGYHSYVWDGKNSQSASVSSGIYFVRLEVEGKSQTHKIVLMK
jgi:flagellar hook assembly protein FlgD